MRGSIKFHNGAWRLRVYAGKDPLTGKRININRTVYTPQTTQGRKAAEGVLAQIVADVESGNITPKKAPPPTQLTVGKAFQKWVETRSPHWKFSTRRSRQSEVKVLSRVKIGRTNFDELELAALEASHWSYLFDQLRKSGMDNNSVFTVYTTIRAGLNWMMNTQQWIDSHPVGTRVTVDPPKNPEVKIPTIDEIKLLFKAAGEEEPAWELWLRIAASFGARRGTLAGLHMADVDPDGYLSFICAISEGSPDMVNLGERPLQEGLLKADNPYTASVETPLIPLLEQQLEIRAAQLDQLGLDPHGTHNDPVCAHPEGGYHLFSPDGEKCWTPNYVTSRFKRTVKKIGMPHMRLHHLKHFAASTMLRRGIPIAIVAQRMGTSEQMILRRYRRFIRGADREAADIMGAELFG